MKQVTMVSLYGQKRGDLERLIKECWEMIKGSKFGRFLKPYHMSQIHGTVIGMEKVIGFDKLVNANIWQASGDDEENMDEGIMMYDELPDIVKRYLPMTVRFGGFERDYKEFKSLGRTAYERSFQVQWSTSKFTLIGWPYQGIYKDFDFRSRKILLELRDEVEAKCKIKHKYEKYRDNDFFMVLGEIKGAQSLTDSEFEKLDTETGLLEYSVREYLRRNPIDVEITSGKVFLAQYEKETLPLDSTNVYCIQNPGINSDFIKELYI